MLKVLVFIFLVISFMLIFGKLIQFAQTTWMIIQRSYAGLRVNREIKKQKKHKSDLKKQFEAKGWRIAK